MTTKQYECYVKSRCKPYVTIPYLVIALNEEAGEIAGWYKKYKLRGNPGRMLRKQDLADELGDLLFYAARLANKNGWSLQDIMRMNKEKLDDRVKKAKVVS